MSRETLSRTVEPATLEMLPTILVIEEASFTAPWTRKMFEAELTQNPFNSCCVAKAGGDRNEDPPSILGYVCFWVVFDELRMMNLAVAPAARRQGIARLLLGHAVKTGQEQGARRALLEVRASNAPALALSALFDTVVITPFLAVALVSLYFALSPSDSSELLPTPA